MAQQQQQGARHPEAHCSAAPSGTARRPRAWVPHIHTPATPAPAPPSSSHARHHGSSRYQASQSRQHDEQQRQQRYDAACQDIKGCQSWLELQGVYDQHGQQLDHFQMVALLSGLAKTAPADAAPLDEVHEYRKLMGKLLAVVADRHVTRFRPREVATTLWAAAKASMPSETWSRWLPALLSAAARQLPMGQFKPQDLSMVLWALATLTDGEKSTQSRQGMANGGTWPQQQQVGMAAAQAGRRRQQSLQLPPGLLETVIAVAEVQMPSFGAQALANTLWALAKLGRRPTDAWLCQALARMEVIMASCTPQALCNVAWSLVILEHSPSASWRQAFLYHSRLALDFATPRVLAQLLWSTARLRLYPEPAWLDTTLQRSVTFEWHCGQAHSSSHNHNGARSGEGAHRQWQAQHKAGAPQDLSNILWALAVQPHFKPGPEHMQRLVAGCVECLPGFDPNELCCVVWALAKLGQPVAPRAMQQLLAAVVRSAHKCTAQGLCNVVWAVATLKLAPEPQWMQEILSNIVPKLEDCGPQELSNLWWALGSLRWRLGPSLREELAAELRVNVLELNAGETAMVLWALARLGLQPHPEVLHRQLQMLCAASANTSSTGSAASSTADAHNESSAGASFSAAWEPQAPYGGSVEALQPRTVAAVMWSLAAMDNAVRPDGKGPGILRAPHLRVLHRLLLCCLQQQGDDHQPQAGQQQPGQGRSAQQDQRISLQRLEGRTDLEGEALAPVFLPWGGKELALSLYSLGRLGVLPPEQWLQAAVARVQQAQPSAAWQQGSGRHGTPRHSSSAGMAVHFNRDQATLPTGSPQLSQGQQAAVTARPSVLMTARDAAMAAHGLARIMRQPGARRRQLQVRQQRQQLGLTTVQDGMATRSWTARPSSSLAGPSAATHGGGGAAAATSETDRRGSALTLLPQKQVAAATRVSSGCVCSLVRCMAAGVDTAATKELTMFLSSLPVLTGQRKRLRHGQGTARVRQLFLPCGDLAGRRRPAASSGTAGHAPPALRLASCSQAIKQLFSAAQQRVQAGQASSREVAQLAAAAARLSMPVGTQYVRAITSACRSMDSSTSRSSGLPAGLPSPSIRDWVLCLWAVERLEPHSALLAHPDMRAWLAQAASSIVNSLSRPGRPLVPMLPQPHGLAQARQQAQKAPATATAGPTSGPTGFATAVGDGSAARGLVVPAYDGGLLHGLGRQGLSNGSAGHMLQAPAAPAQPMRPDAALTALPQGMSRRRLRQLQWKQSQEQLRRLRDEQPRPPPALRHAMHSRLVATPAEVQAAAAAAARLARSAADVAGQQACRAGKLEEQHSCRGVVLHEGDDLQQELSCLATQLQQASGRLRQVQWRRVAINRAARIKQTWVAERLLAARPR